MVSAPASHEAGAFLVSGEGQNPREMFVID